MNGRATSILGWIAGLLLTGGTEAATTWTTDLSTSRLQFFATMAGGEFDGRFARFRPEIVFDPADLQASRLDVQVETASADTGDDQRDRALAGPDFFASERWPRADFSAVRFIASGPDRFEALGTLTIRGESKAVSLPFVFKSAPDGATAEMTGGTTIRRLDFGVGQGEWRDTEWVGDEVRIRFTLILHRK